MNWQSFITLFVVLGVAIALVWRSSGKKAGHGTGCGCGCHHHPADEAKTKNNKTADPAGHRQSV